MLIRAACDNDIHPPLFGGTQRTFGLCRGLAARHRVEALCVVPNRCAAPAEETAQGVRILRRKAWYTSAAWRLEQARLAPVFAAAYGHALGARGLARAYSGPGDVLLADINLTGLFGAGVAPLAVYTAQNVEADHVRSAGAPVAWPSFWAERRRAFEAEAVARAALTVVCGDEDAERMRALHGAREVAVVPNGYDETAVRAPAAGERERARAALGLGPREYAALFVGSDVPHNRAALALLLDHVFPPLAGEGVRLVVAGSVTRALAGRRERWLIARPEAPDLSPVLHAADAGLNPVASGGGSNVKLPTYLAAGLATITTPHGLRGYAALRPHVVVVALEDLAAALRERPAGWRAAGAALPAAVAEHAWGRLGARLGDLLEARVRGVVPAERAAAGGVRAAGAPARAAGGAGA